MKIAISGAGIAGPTLAYWLERTGHEVLLVETAPTLRTGGYVIDFWGIGYDIAERMGLIPRIREVGYQVREVRFVDQSGRTSAGFSPEVVARPMRGRFTSLRRSDLAATIYGALDGRVERNDLRSMNDSTRAILTNGDVIAVDQDWGGSQGYKLKGDSATQVWMKPMSNGDRAVVLLNRGATAATISTTMSEIGLPAGPHLERDVWTHVERTADSVVSASVAAHSVAMFVVRKQPRRERGPSASDESGDGTSRGAAPHGHEYQHAQSRREEAPH